MIYTKKVFLKSQTPFRLHSNINEWIEHNHTPPYLSATPDVRHINLRGDANTTCLILSSDGLFDLYRERVGNSDEMALKWVEVVSGTTSKVDNLALRLLQDSLGGDDPDLVSRMITVEMQERWMDDTTILVLPLNLTMPN